MLLVKSKCGCLTENVKRDAFICALRHFSFRITQKTSKRKIRFLKSGSRKTIRGLMTNHQCYI